MAIICIADPAAKVERGGLAVDEPAKSDALDAAFDEIVMDHWFRVQCGRGWGGAQGESRSPLTPVLPIPRVEYEFGSRCYEGFQRESPIFLERWRCLFGPGKCERTLHGYPAGSPRRNRQLRVVA